MSARKHVLRAATMRPAGEIVGKASAGDIELRFDDLGLDEIVAEHAHVHLERMSDDTFSLLIETRKERGCYFVRRARTPIMASEVFREPTPKRKQKPRKCQKESK